jgi:hypothetical protein
MCFGGGSSKGSTITMPDTGAYDRQFDRRLQMLQMSQSSELTGYQAELQQAQYAQEGLLRELVDLREERAESAASVEAEAKRMSNIIGPPPPDVSAKAPVIGEDRVKERTRRSGKSNLRIGRKVASSAGAGAGLNII